MLTDLKGEMKNNTIIVGDFNNARASMYRKFRQNINKKISALNDILALIDLTDIYRERTLHPKTAEYTFFSNVHGTFPV